jgi:glutamate racemase
MTIHSGDAIVEYLQKEYNCTKKYDDTKIILFASSNPNGLRDVAVKWLDNYHINKGI